MAIAAIPTPSAPTATAASAASVDQGQRAAFSKDGYHIARGLFSPAEMDDMRAHYMELHRRAPIYEVYSTDPASPDPLKVYPRIMQPHRWDLRSRAWLLDPRIVSVLSRLIDDIPCAAQSMFYFKPPLADGQGFHQDNFYLMADPGTCYAAWLSVDDADAGNGALYVLPGSHRAGIASPSKGTAKEWGSIIPEPEVSDCTEVSLRSGDCLFFHGALIHGSLANRSTVRWRRSFICHFVGERATREVAAYYHPIIRPDGTIAPLVGGLSMPPGPAGR